MRTPCNPPDSWRCRLIGMADLLRHLADITSNNREDARVMVRLANDIAVISPAAGEHLRPAIERLREIEGRYCDTTEWFHEAARKLSALAGEA